ncbi:hypothetical protein [Hahella ganghwensis]|uniref:hypothetical protein n=1 Tax=Hahella ganghwensis TaxID=286420 RepID=UPI00036AD8D7|nr:hypothetical protein [Hahella ganghwensis]
MRSALLATSFSVLSFVSSQSLAIDFISQFGLEGRYFVEEGDAGQKQENGSVWARPELYYEWNDGYDRLTFIGYYRHDENDDERTHGDVREANWLHIGDYWETRIGVGKVFWGVTESQHLVDVINQTDLVESPDGEEKLGQPMFKFSTAQDQVVLDFFVLPYFRERNYPGVEGRLGVPFEVDMDHARYEADEEESHPDIAVRYAIIGDDFEVSLSHFSGTSREPNLVFNQDLANPKLVPVYPLIEQTGLVMQYIMEGWLFKFEGIVRSGFANSQGDEERYGAVTAGFEYTQVGVFGSDADLGWLLEGLWDERGDEATTFLERDIFLGWRWAFNDINSTEILMGAIYDPETNEQLYSIEASRRLFDIFTVNMEVRAFEGGDPLPTATVERLQALSDPDNKTGALQNEDYVQLEMVYYF